MDRNEKPSFAIGERVQVADDWFVTELRGAIGTVVAPYPDCDRMNEGGYWVEFDERINAREDGSWTSTAEIDATSLRRV